MSTTIMGSKNVIYTTALAQLNQRQRQAVESIEGPLLVIAGPGTGKTQVITMRMAHILQQTDTPPEAILALTFTESAAATMRRRLVNLVGAVGYRVSIQTFHALANDILMMHPDIFGLTQSAQPLSDVDRLLLIKRLVHRLPLSTLRPLNAPDLYVSKLGSAISQLKKEAITVAEWREQVAAETADLEDQASELTKAKLLAGQKQVAKWQELAAVYEAYEQELQQAGHYDYDDMITRVNQALQTNDELRAEYQEKYLYVLVDEYQDTNAAQNELVSHLASFWGEQANICVVGDPDQSIYRFQGASIENMLAFRSQYPAAEIIVLETGYRCPQLMYDAAAGLIHHNQLRAGTITQMADQALQTVSPKAGIVAVAELPTAELEAEFIADQVAARIKSGVKPDEIAVLFRQNKEVDSLVPAFQARSIPVTIQGGQNILLEPAIQDLVAWWQTLHRLQQGIDDYALFQLLIKPWWGIPVGSVIQVAQAAKVSRLSLWSLLTQDFQLLDKYQTPPGLTQLEFYQLQQVAERWQTWLQRETQVPINRWIWEVLTESGWLTWIKTQPNWPLLAASLAALQREITAWTLVQPQLQLAGVIARLELYTQYRIPIEIESDEHTVGKVTLSTAHKAKGREWQTVFVSGCIDGRWGNTSRRELLPLPAGLIKHADITEKDRNEDERRLMYVAVTRAQHELILTLPAQSTQGSQLKETLPSEFLTELKSWSQPWDQAELDRWVASQTTEPAGWRQPPTSPLAWIDQKHLFDRSIASFAWSASALNTYLRSPDDFVFQYLLRLQEPPSATLAFGSAVHQSLERFFKARLRDEQPTLNQVLQWFTAALEAEPLTTDELQARLTQGRNVLTQYFESKLQNDLPLVWLIERRFGSGSQRVRLDDVPLTGRIDRIDWLDPKEKLVRVIDYKTGNPRTLGELTASTQSSQAELSEREQQLPPALQGGYKRQLLFYKLLTQLDKTFDATVVDGCFEFVQADKTSGKLITRTLELPDEEVALLADLLREVAAELTSGAFFESWSPNQTQE